MSRKNFYSHSFKNRRIVRERSDDPIENANFDLQIKEAMVEYFDRANETHPGKIEKALEQREYFDGLIKKYSDELANRENLLAQAKQAVKNQVEKIRQLKTTSNICHNLTPIERKTRKAERLMKKLSEMGVDFDMLLKSLNQKDEK